MIEINEGVAVSEVAKKLKISFEQVQQFFKEFSVDIKEPTDLIPYSIIQKIPAIAAKFETKKPRRLSEVKSNEVETNGSSNPEESSLSVPEAKTIEQVQSSSDSTSANIIEQLRMREEDLAIQTGYSDAQSILALQSLGRNLALTRFYNQRSHELDLVQERLNKSELSVETVAARYGINISGIVRQQQIKEEERIKNNLKAQEAAERKFNGEELSDNDIPDSLTTMKLQLEELGKSQ